MLSTTSIARLIDPASGLAVFDADGRKVGWSTVAVAPATLLVRDVADALRVVGEGGLVEDEVDRDTVWQVEAFALSGEVVDALEGEFGSAVALYEAVVALGYDWEVLPTPSAP